MVVPFPALHNVLPFCPVINSNSSSNTYRKQRVREQWSVALVVVNIVVMWIALKPLTGCP